MFGFFKRKKKQKKSQLLQDHPLDYEIWKDEAEFKPTQRTYHDVKLYGVDTSEFMKNPVVLAPSFNESHVIGKVVKMRYNTVVVKYIDETFVPDYDHALGTQVVQQDYGKPFLMALSPIPIETVEK